MKAADARLLGGGNDPAAFAKDRDYRLDLGDLVANVLKSAGFQLHTRSTARPTIAIKQPDVRLNASSDDKRRSLRPAPLYGTIESWLLSFMYRPEPRPGGAAATLERGPEHA